MSIPVIAAGVPTLTVALMAMAWFVLPVILDRPVQVKGAVPAREILQRLNNAAPLPLPSTWSHEAPETPFSVEEAHAVMRGYHRPCHVDTCFRKRSAMRTLYRAGVLVPDARIEQWVR
jgi:hypothetical protein